MSDGLDVIIVDDDPGIGQMLKEMVDEYYTWGETVAFHDPHRAIDHCMQRDNGLAIFVVDVFLGGMSGFLLLDAVSGKYPSVYEDAIIISGRASEDIVNMCLASGVHYLLEKPLKPYALQLAIRAITAKYINFAKRLLQDAAFADRVANL